MKMVFIYGPPAVGKYTVAKELSAITGYRYFINHQASDAVSSILDFEDNPSLFRSVANEVKNLILRKAIELKIPGLIMTFCYSRPDSDKNLRETLDILEPKGVETFFTRIHCTDEELYRRVQHPSRKQISVKKLTSIEELKKALNQHGFKEEISYVRNLNIDTTNMPPREVAEKIARHHNFKLLLQETEMRNIYSGFTKSL